MSKELLHALVADVDRLLAAGGTLAANDRGLQRREQALRELGTKVPALAPVAGAVRRVLDADAPRATPVLLDLLIATQQVRFSLATVGAEGPLELVSPSGPWATDVPAAEIYSLVEALQQSGQGRVEVVQEAVERQRIADLRLVDPLLEGLADGYDEVADLVADKAIPSFGSAILPEVQSRFNCKGKLADARRLRAIISLAPELGMQRCRTALAEGSPQVRVQALRLLAQLDPGEAERAALEQLGHKPHRDVRHAALEVLASSQKDAALDVLTAAFLSKDTAVTYIAAESLKKLAHPKTTERLVQELQRTAAEVDALRSAKGRKPGVPAKGRGKGQNEETKLEEAVQRARELLEVLGARKDSKAVPALVALLRHAVTDLREAALEALTALQDPEGLEAAAELIEDPKVWSEAITAAWHLLSKPRYERLAPLCANLSDAKRSQRQRGDWVLELFDVEAQLAVGEDEGEDDWEYRRVKLKKPRTDWDPRWVKVLRPHLDGPNRAGVAIALEVVQGAKIIPELLKRLVPSVQKGECGVVEALGRLRVREAVAPMIELMPGQQSNHYCIHDALRHIGDPRAVPLLRKLLEKTRDSYRKQRIEEVIDALEDRPSR